jgi:NAD(P)-dependent dehydrogenase (short-subunit alcohol dehydrogenase family)
MALGLLRHGVAVAAVDRDGETLEELAGTAKEGDRARSLLTIAKDLTADGAAEHIGLQVLARYGRIEILVNNAGMGLSVLWPDRWTRPVKFWEIEPDQWRLFFKTNTDTQFLMSRMAVPHMMRSRWGRIINVTTSLGTMLRSGRAPYGPSKAAAEAMTSVMAEELKDTGITVNALTPGGLTNTGANLKAPFDRARMLQPAVMVPPLLWLISDAAAGVTARRFVAARWDPALPSEQAAAAAGAPVGWPTAGNEAMNPAHEPRK